MVLTTGGRSSGVSPVVGVILMVAIVVALGAVVSVFVLDTGEMLTAGDTAEMQNAVELRTSGTGVEFTAVSLTTAVEVQIDGATVAVVPQSEVGTTLSIPAVPGERVSVVARGEGEGTLLTSVDVDENPSLLVYYPLNEADSGTVDDESGNGHHGTIAGDVTFNDGGVTGDGYASFVDGHISAGAEPAPTGSQTVVTWYNHTFPSAEDEHRSMFGGDSFSADIDVGHAIGHSPNSEAIWLDIYSGDPYGNHRHALKIHDVIQGEWAFTASAYDAHSNTHRGLVGTTYAEGTPDFLTHSIDWSGTDVTVGASNFDYHGDLAEFRMYNHDLTKDEMLMLRAQHTGEPIIVGS